MLKTFIAKPYLTLIVRGFLAEVFVRMGRAYDKSSTR